MSDKQIIVLVSILGACVLAIGVTWAVRSGSHAPEPAVLTQVEVARGPPTTTIAAIPTATVPEPSTRPSPATAAEPPVVPAFEVFRAFDAASKDARDRSADGSPSPGLIVMAGNKPGFKEGDRFYGMGIPAEEFIHDFGRPEGGGPYAFLRYNNDGFMLNLDDRRRVSRYIFYARPGENQGHFRAAPVVTDKGVRSGDTAADVLRAYGIPSGTSRCRRGIDVGLPTARSNFRSMRASSTSSSSMTI